MPIFNRVELKRVLKKPKTNDTYLVYVGGSGGSFQFYVSDNVFVWLDAEPGKYYKFVDEKILYDLLSHVKKQRP